MPQTNVPEKPKPRKNSDYSRRARQQRVRLRANTAWKQLGLSSEASCSCQRPQHQDRADTWPKSSDRKREKERERERERERNREREVVSARMPAPAFSAHGAPQASWPHAKQSEHSRGSSKTMVFGSAPVSRANANCQLEKRARMRPECCERSLGFPALVQSLSSGRCAPRRPLASPCPREQSQERQGAAADSPTNSHNEKKLGGSAKPAAVPGQLGVCGRLPGRERGPVGSQPVGGAGRRTGLTIVASTAI